MDWTTKQKYSPHLKFDCFIGNQFWKNTFSGTFPKLDSEKAFLTEDTLGFLICGKSGTGKSTLAKAYAGEMGEYGYTYLFLNFEELIGENIQETKEMMDSFFSFLSTGEKYFVLLEMKLDNLEQSKAVKRRILFYFQQKFQELEDEDLPVIFTLVSNSWKILPEEWLGSFHLCVLELPNEEERREYFQMMLFGNGDLFKSVELKEKTILEKTKKFSYIQLNELVTFIRVLLNGESELTQEIFLLALEKIKWKKKKKKQKKEKINMPQFIFPSNLPMQTQPQTTPEEMKKININAAVNSGDFDTFKENANVEVDEAEVKEKGFLEMMEESIDLTSAY